jgi:hypothetical protein
LRTRPRPAPFLDRLFTGKFKTRTYERLGTGLIYTVPIRLLCETTWARKQKTGQRYTVKRYESRKAAKGDSWRHKCITLQPLNPDFKPIVLTGKDDGDLQVIADVVEILGRARHCTLIAQWLSRSIHVNLATGRWSGAWAG